MIRNNSLANHRKVRPFVIRRRIIRKAIIAPHESGNPIPIGQPPLSNAFPLHIETENRLTSVTSTPREQKQIRHLTNDSEDDSPPKPNDLSSPELLAADEKVAKDFAAQGLQKKPGVHYISTFQRLMHIGKFINHFYNYVAKLLPDFKGDQTREETLNDQLNAYADSKQLLREVLFEYNQLAQEIETFYAEINSVDMTTAEALQFFGFEEFYKNIRSKQNVESKAFVSLNSKLDDIVSEFVDKTRKMFVGIYNIRHIDQFLFRELKPYANDYSDPSVFKDPVKKIDQGKKMVNVFVKIKDKVTGFVSDVQEGITASDRIRDELLYTLKAMDRIPEMKEEEISALVGNSVKSTAVWTSSFAAIALIMALVL